MALDFLSLIPTVAAAYSALKSSKPTAAENAQMQELANERYYQQQAADPNSQLMKAYANANRDQLDREYAGSITDLINQNRRQTALGRQPLFDPERGDQQIYRAQQLGYQANADKARAMAQQTIAGLAQGSGNLASGYGGTVANAQKRQTQQSYLPVNLANAGTSIFDAIQRGSAATPDIAWQSPRFSGTPTAATSTPYIQSDYNTNPNMGYA